MLSTNKLNRYIVTRPAADDLTMCFTYSVITISALGELQSRNAIIDVTLKGMPSFMVENSTTYSGERMLHSKISHYLL